MKALKELKKNGWTVKKAGHRYSKDYRLKPVLLIQDKAKRWGLTIDGNGRQLGRQLRQLAKKIHPFASAEANICRASQQQ